MNLLPTSSNRATSCPADASSFEALESYRQRLAEGRAQAVLLHREGAAPEQVCRALRDSTDAVVTAAYRDALDRALPESRTAILRNLAIVGVGGYGRGDLAPFSDIDLLFLVDPRGEMQLRAVISELVRTLWDVGLKLSQSVRSPAECVAAARQDLCTRTALGEARLLVGRTSLFAEMQRRVHRFLSSASLDRFLAAALTERANEHEDYFASTVCLLEPNVKKSPGGLRDLHLLRWVARCRHGTADPESLRRAGQLSEADAAVLAESTEYLLRIRHELHLHAGGSQDVLTREEQLRLAQWLGYRDEGPLLSVERFMQHHYRRTAALNDVVMRFVDRARRRSLLRRLADSLVQRRVGEFRRRGGRMLIDPAARSAVLSNATRMLRLFDLARRRGLAIDQADLERIRISAPDCALDAQTRREFLRALADPVRLGTLLRGLSGAGLLARLIPPFEHARGLIQFNLVHRYTLDQHTLLAVENAAARAADRSPLGRAYREIRRKDLLHLALLCHDLGKGRGGDHCEVGERLADDVAGEFGLPPHDRELLALLVRQHLLMAQTAFRRDFSDERTLVQFARAVATPEALRMLYVMTAADTQAVAPGNWTAWKESLLTDLYERTMEELSGEAPGGDEEAGRIRRSLYDALHIQLPARWLEAQLELMPAAYLRRTDPVRVAADLEMLRALPQADVEVGCTHDPALSLTEVRVVTREDLIPGVFSKISGALAALGFQILGAQIITRADGSVIDTFRGQDEDFAGEPPPARRREIVEVIRGVLRGERTVESLFRSRLAPARAAVTASPVLSQVEIDNGSSDRFTIVEVFTTDRPGLLYDITRTLFELGLSVHSARISTHLEQVVDVFYVASRDGRKISDEAAHDVIRARLLVVVNS